MADLLPNPGLGGEVDFWQQQQRWSLRVPSIDWNNDEEFFGHMFFLALFVAFFRFHPLVLRGVWLVRTKMVSWFHSYWREISRFLPCSLFVLLCVVCAPPPSWPTAFVKSSSVGQGLFSSTNVNENIWKQKMTACAHMWQRHLRFDWDWCPSMPSAVAKNEHQVFEGSVTHAKSRHEPLEHWRYSSQLVNPTSPALPLGHPQHCPYPVKAMKNLLAWTCLIRKLNKKTPHHQHIDSSRLILISFSNSPTPGCCFGTLSCRRIATRDVRGEPRGEWRGEWRGEPLPTRLRAPEATFDVTWRDTMWPCFKAISEMETSVKKICKFGVETLRNKNRQYDIGRS